MPRNDQKIPRRTEKLLYQEASSRCSFCTEAEIALLDIHHIEPRASGGSNDLSNLILVCKNCHARVESGAITHAELVRKKREIRIIRLVPRDAPKEVNSVFIGGDVNNSLVAASITYVSNHRRLPQQAPLQGTIGADLDRNNYIKHLISRYHEYRKADASYGRAVEKYKGAVIHANIKQKFKAPVGSIPVGRFEELVHYLQGRIDQTIQGKRNRTNRVSNYSSFEEYVRDLHGI